MRYYRAPASTVDIAELTSLLQDLFSTHPGISIRLKLQQQPWPEFAQVIVFARHAILLAHMPTRTVTNISDLKNISEFQIDKAHAGLIPFHTYYVEHTVTGRMKRDGLLYVEHTI